MADLGTPHPHAASDAAPGDAARARPPLDAAALREALIPGQGFFTALDVVAATGSTNADLVAAAQAGGAAAGTVLVAEEQTAGRGRLGRGWSAPARSGLFFSVLLEPRAPAERWGWLPLLAGVATATALTRAAGVRTTLKWPNDLLVAVDGEERKTGGILAERTETAAGTPAVVLGIGVNVSLSAAELPVPRAGSLLLAGAGGAGAGADSDAGGPGAGGGIDRGPLLVEVLRALADWYGRWSAVDGDADAAGLREAYTEGCATLGRQVTAQLPDGAALTGAAAALDGDGRLLIATADGTRQGVAAADIVHLR